MIRPKFLQWSAFALAGVCVLGMGSRPSIMAGASDPQDEYQADEPAIFYVEAPEKTQAELKTLLKLQDCTPIHFPNETPLDEVVNFLRKATIDPSRGFPRGLRFYVDPDALQDADKPFLTTIKIDLDDVPLDKSIKLILSQISLIHKIDPDGTVIITSGAIPADSAGLYPESGDWRSLQRLRLEVQALRRGVSPDRKPVTRPRVATIQVEAPPKSIAALKTDYKILEPVPIKFDKPTSLADVVAFIRKTTIDPKLDLPRGLPVFVDPKGLADADKTLASKIFFEMEGMPLGTSIRWMLKQLSLTYSIDPDGLILITSNGCFDSPIQSNHQANEEAFRELKLELFKLRQEIHAIRGEEPPRGLGPDKGAIGGTGNGFR